MIEPRYITFGWFPRFSWPYLAVSFDSRIVRASDGSPLAGMVALNSGWWSLATQMVTSNADGGQRLTLLGADGTQVPFPLDPALAVGVRASAGNWATYHEPTLTYNGLPIATSTTYLPQSLQVAGDWLSILSNEGPESEPEWQRWRTRVFEHGVLQRVIRHLCPAHYSALNADGAFAYSDGASGRIALADGSDLDVTSTTPPMEFCPVATRDESGNIWLWSPAGENADCLIVRRLGWSEGWKIDLPFGVVKDGLDVTFADGQWHVAWNDNRGQCGVATVVLNPADVQPLPIRMGPPPPPAPKVTLTLDKTSGTVPLTVNATMVTAPDSGPVNAIRWLLDGRIDGGNDVETHGYYITQAGLHLAAIRAAGPGGQMETPPQTITAQPASRFQLGINAGFGYPLSDGQLEFLIDQGVRTVRGWIGADWDHARVMIEQFAKYPQVTPIYLIQLSGTTQTQRKLAVERQLSWVPVGSTIEFGNEPQIGGGDKTMEPALSVFQYVELASAAQDTIARRQLTCYYVCQWTLDKIGYLEGILALAPWMERVSVHHYTEDALMPHADIPALTRVLGGRRFIVTEAGRKVGPKAWYSMFLWWKMWHAGTEAQQLSYVKAEAAMWRLVPTCDGVCFYQMNSSTSDLYGFNRTDGTPRPAWGVFA